MFGVVTRNEPVVDWSEFDRSFFEMKAVSGLEREPMTTAINMVACFADNATATDRPDLVPVSETGERATPDRPYFDWSYVCPNREAYRDTLLEIIADAGAASGAVRLDDVGFPRDEYCHCTVCRDRFASSSITDWRAWRAETVTDFLTDAADRIPGDLYLTVHPDPYHDHLRSRCGLDLETLAPLVDELVVPLYDRAYSTTYWLEILSTGFRDRIDGRLGIELYAAEAELDRLVKAATVVRPVADAVYFGYDASAGRAAIRRLHASDREGVVHGSPAEPGDSVSDS